MMLVDLEQPEQPSFEDGRPVPVENFDFEAVDRALNPAAPPTADPHAFAGEAIKRILNWCYTQPKMDPQAAFRRFLVLSAMVAPEATRARNFTELATLANCTKANISLLCREFRDQFGNIAPRARTEAGCQRMREARLRKLGRS